MKDVFLQTDSRSKDGDWPQSLLDMLVTPQLPTWSRLCIPLPIPFSFRPCLIYLLLLSDTDMLFF